MKKEWEKWNKHMTNDFINLFWFSSHEYVGCKTHMKNTQVDSHRYVRKSEVIMRTLIGFKVTMAKESWTNIVV